MVGETSDELMEQVREFLIKVLDKRKHLSKFQKGVRELKTTAKKQDKVVKGQIEDLALKCIEFLKNQKELDGTIIEQSIAKLGTQIKELFDGYISHRDKMDNLMIRALDNFVNAVMHHDDIAKDKIIELFNNFKESYELELTKLKVQVADLLSENEALKKQIESIQAGKEAVAKEIPTLPSEELIEIQCPMCRQAYWVSPQTKTYKCDVCGTIIHVQDRSHTS